MTKLTQYFSALALITAAPLAAANSCDYQIVDEWANGFKAEVIIQNDGPAVSDWSVSWQWSDGSSFDHGWSGEFTCADGRCTVTPPGWFNQLNSGQSMKFGFIGNKTQAAAEQVVVTGEICGSTAVIPSASWGIDSDASHLQYVSVKKEHLAETNTFPVMEGAITADGSAVLAIDLTQVATGVDIRNTRLNALLFETEFLPTAWFETRIDPQLISSMPVGAAQLLTLEGELSIHAMRQAIEAKVMVAKLSESRISVSSVTPVNVSAADFDMAAGIEALRLVAGLSSIGESVPVYFSLVFELQQQLQVEAPAQPQAPSELFASFDPVSAQSSLTWLDNSDSEDAYIVRRKSDAVDWQTTARLDSQASALMEALPDTGEFDYKVIAVNQGMPSYASNIAQVTVTQASPLVRGQQIYQGNCAGCHGIDGEGIASNPAINTERDVAAMVAYIRDFMPLGTPQACDQQCAEDVSEYIQTLWVTEPKCDIEATPVSYGARQLKILTRYEYQNTVTDLVGIDYAVSTGLSEDAKLGLFRNNTFAAIVPTSYSNYLLVAEEIANWSAERDYAPMLSCDAYDQDCSDAFIEQIAPMFFRRPLTSDEVRDYSAMANGSFTSGDVHAGIAMALEGLLSSPQFLYRHELGTANPDNAEIDADAFELSSYEMATFLAYTFTGTTPDALLRQAAANDELRNTDNIVAHASRLVGQSESVMSQFVGSWLGTEDLEQAAKDVAVWDNFDALVPHLQAEINKTFSHIMLDDTESFSSLYNANFSFLNATLAQHYGIDGVSGEQLQKVTTTDRGGILANGAFMARWAEAAETSPILRSVRVRRRMLCQDQPDPPAGTFAAREEKLAELSSLLQDPTTTNRVKYHRLTEDTPCTNCHLQYINPLGFGMEDFDTVGRVRSQDANGNPVNASGELFAPVNYSDLDSVFPFEGSKGLGQLLSSLESAQNCLPRQMFRYVIGVGHQQIDPNNPQGLQLSDQEKSSYACEVDELTDTMLSQSPKAMLEKFAILDAVRYRKAWTRSQ